MTDQLTTDAKNAVTQDKIQDQLKEIVGPEIAEIRKAMIAKGKEMQESFDDALDQIKKHRDHSQHGQKGMELAKLVKCLAAGKKKEGDTIKLAKSFAKQWGYDGIPEAIDKGFSIDPETGSAGVDVVKAMGESTLADGGALVPDGMTSDFIQIIHDEMTVGTLGARQVSVPTGSLPIRKGTSGATAYWVGESSNITPSTPQTGLVNLRTHKLAALVALSNELIFDSSDFALQWVRDELASVMEETLDLAYLRGLGTANSPKGVLYQVVSANKNNATQAGAAATLAEMSLDLTKMLYLLLAYLKRIVSGGWVMHARSWYWLFQILTSDGYPAFRDEMRAGTLFGFPFRLTSQIPINLGTGTNESEIYLGDWSRFMLGFTGGMRIDVSTEAAYYDGAAQQAAFSRDETVIRAVTRNGCEPRYAGQEFAVLDAVKWGA